MPTAGEKRRPPVAPTRTAPVRPPTRRPSPARDAGATMVLVTVLVSVVLLGAAAFTVDLGNAYARKRSLQTSADLAALAGVARLPDGIAAARTAVLASLCTDSGSGGSSENTVLGWPDGTCPTD